MRIDSINRWPTIITLLMLYIAGCSADAQRYIRFPALASPGPAAVQRAQAIQHDPYPLNDIAPEIVGGRPLSYQQSLTEVDRARLTPPPPGTFQSLPPPGTQVFAPPVVSSPFAVAPPQAAVPLGTPAPIVTSPFPAPAAPTATMSYPPAPAPFAAPYPATPAPVVASPYPAAPVPRAAPYQYQQRAPY
jgi:hypothetical protein